MKKLPLILVAFIIKISKFCSSEYWSNSPLFKNFQYWLSVFLIINETIFCVLRCCRVVKHGNIHVNFARNFARFFRRFCCCAAVRCFGCGCAKNNEPMNDDYDDDDYVVVIVIGFCVSYRNWNGSVFETENLIETGIVKSRCYCCYDQSGPTPKDGCDTPTTLNRPENGNLS